MKSNQLSKAISLALLASTTSYSAEFIVTTTGDQGGGVPNEVSGGVFEINTLRSAIELADDESAYPGADTISFAPSLFTSGEAEINLNAIGGSNSSGSNTANSALRIRSEITVAGPVNNTLTLTAGELRHFQVNSGGQLNLSHVTLNGGRTPNNGAGVGGSIITLSGGGLTLNNSTLSNNQARSGGALYLSAGSLPATINATEFSNNSTIGFIGDGGAVFHDSDELLLISESRFINNYATYDGGAISVQGQVSVNSSTFEFNTAMRRGGAMNIINGGVLTMVNSTISHNTAIEVRGGGIHSSEYVADDSNQSVIMNSTIIKNRSNIDESGTLLTRLRGDGIYFESSGGGLHAYYANAFLVHNTLITNNTELMEQIPDDVAAQLDAASSHNLISVGDSVLGISDGVNGNQIGTRDVPIEADIGPLADNGGPSPTHLPSLNSPAIDAGDNNLCPDFDQRGLQRPQDGDGDGFNFCDIGAVEARDDLIFKNDFEN